MSTQDPSDLYRKRIHNIIVSYRLTGDDCPSFDIYLQQLMEQFPLLLLELALVETLARRWLHIPLEKGVAFLQSVYNVLQEWQTEAFKCHLTPLHFEMITGLDPSPVFDSLNTTLQEWWGSLKMVRATVQMPVTEIL
jgi:hypothetical protein